ncbi:GNAT family N-acetyltransferase [Chitinophaga eiseniae]|uniref:GNAT family N-acetyltransferase n=1 Tax=Chitinophaga eiseniae TaxID=634771 RepID=A0A847SSK1_9BACT|nr:GNAT family N-acetyltransferase [Chitinophaga eiseniae]NLR81028.1 GNAT family N-acetyltransferase [Chitinophaga eiseniae]
MDHSNTIVKPVTREDISAYTDVFMEAYNQPPWNYQWQPADAARYLMEYLLSDNFKGFSLYENDVFAGALFARTKTWWNGRQLYIDEFFIAPSMQGRGYGKLLISHAEQFAREQQLVTITLMTHRFMPAMKFYTGIDFMQAPPFVILFKPLNGDI